MRRVMLLVFGFGAGGMVLLCLISSINAKEPIPLQKVFLSYNNFYPHTVMGTNLLALELQEYDGPFWEDGSNEEVFDIAALVVENQGGLMVAGGAVIVEMDAQRLVFEFSFLPPGGKALVLEKDRKRCPYETPIACYGWAREEYPENPGLVRVETVGLTGLYITNYTGCTVPGVEIHYKNYDNEKAMYIGGITYLVSEKDLMPREIRRVEPPNFASRESRVVCVWQAMDR